MAGEFGADTWDGGSEKITGHTNVWAPMTLDEARGLLYLPVSTPSNDFYGGARLGRQPLRGIAGLSRCRYRQAQVALPDRASRPLGLRSARRRPSLVTIHVNGRKIDAVVQLTKTGWAFVFDRVTGKPVWPIEERPVPASDVPGEQASPTQPFPTKPPAFERQGVTLDDAFDLTPELKAEAQAAMQKYRIGPIFTPPSLEGTLMRPGTIGGANWAGGAIDPETGMLYVKSTNHGRRWRALVKPAHTSEVDAEYVMRAAAARPRFIMAFRLLKPPYGHLTAIDLNKGEIVWQVPFGDNAASAQQSGA